MKAQDLDTLSTYLGTNIKDLTLTQIQHFRMLLDDLSDELEQALKELQK